MSPCSSEVPPVPERAPGAGRDMAYEDWQHDAWLPEPPDKEFRKLVQETIDELLERHTSVVDTSSGKPMTTLDVDPLCIAAARLLEKLMKRVYRTQGG